MKAWPLFFLLLSGCMRLDSLFFLPETASSDANLMAGATEIPSAQIQEIKGPIQSESVEVNAYLLTHTAADGTDVKRHTYGILYCHGQTGNIASFALRAQELWKLGYTVLVFDYHGYGKTPGTPSESNVLADSRAARTYLEGRTDLGLAASRVIIYGWSLGTGICGQVAAERSPTALVLEAPITSVAGILSEATELNFPGAWFLHTKMDLLSKIGQFTGSLLVMHGTKDTTLPYKFGEQIHEAASATTTKKLWTSKDADHLTVPCSEKTGADKKTYNCPGGFASEYLSTLTVFLDTAFGI